MMHSMMSNSQFNTRNVTLSFALLLTATSIAMASVSAWERGGTTADRLLLLALSVSICLGTHLIPALTKNKLAWLLWLGCLLCAIYSHLTFLTNASNHSGEVRSQGSAQVTALKEQIEADKNALDAIKARPVTLVATELANTFDYRHRSALRAELSESKRAAILRDDLIRLSGLVTTAEKSDSVDPVTALLAKVTDGSEAKVNLAIWLGISVLLELMGALLWFEVLNWSRSVENDDANTTSGKDPTVVLKEAIDAGICKPTVAGIRTYMRCGQSQAMTLRRALH